MRIIDIDNIIQNMKDDTAFVMKCEEVFHDKVSSASAKIINARDAGKNIVCLTGPSGSGKTTTAMRFKEYIENLGVKVNMLSMDNFFLPVRLRPAEATDWESPYCVDFDRLSDAMRRLSQGEEVELPSYDFVTCDYGPTHIEQGYKDGILLVEGIHMLNPMIFDKVRDIATGVYVAPRTRIVTYDDKVLRPAEIRVARRMIRDYVGRGHSLVETVEKAESVNNGEKNYIQPYKDNASIHIDTFHDYEPCILAQYLKEIPEFKEQMTDEFARAHKLKYLMDVVQSVPPLKTSYVPLNSLMREFVGGSRYDY